MEMSSKDNLGRTIFTMENIPQKTRICNMKDFSTRNFKSMVKAIFCFYESLLMLATSKMMSFRDKVF